MESKIIKSQLLHISGGNKHILSSGAKFELYYTSISSRDMNLFIAKAIIRDISKWNTSESIEASYFNTNNFMQDIEMIALLIPLLSFNHQKSLCDIIKLSSSSNCINLAAANAIFILNRSNFEFRNLDFSRINIQGVDLSESFFFNVNFERSCLKKVNFSQSKLYNCNFKNCDLTDALFSNFTLVGKIKSPIKKVIISKDSHFLLAICEIDTELWDLHKNTKIYSFNFSCDTGDFSPYNNLMALVSKNSRKKLYKLDKLSGQIIEKWDKNYYYKNENIYDVIFSPCGKYVVFCGLDFIEMDYTDAFNNCKKWNACPWTNLVFTKCGKFLIFGSRNMLIYRLSIENGNIEQFYNPKDKGKWLAFSPNYKYLSWNGNRFYVLNYETKELVFSSNWHRLDKPLSNSWSLNGNKIISLYSSEICLCDIRRQVVTAQIRENICMINSVCFSKYDKIAVIGRNDGFLMLWNLETHKNQKKIELIESVAVLVVFSPCEDYVYRVSTDYSVDKCHISENHSENLIKGLTTKKIICAAFSNCQQYCALGLSDFSIDLWNIPTRKLFFKLKKDNFSSISTLIFSSSGKYLFVGYSFSIILWNLEQKKSIADIGCETNALALSPNEKYIASSHNEVVIIRKNDQRDYGIIGHLKNDNNMLVFVSSLTFSDCSQFLYIGDRWGRIYVWDFIKMEKVIEFWDNKTTALQLITTPRGLIALMANQVVLWNEKNSRKVKVLDIKFSNAGTISATKFGDWVAFGGLHKTVKICKL